MVYINLLPIEEIKKHTRAVQEITLFAVSLVCVLVVLGLVGFYQATKVSNLEKKIVNLEAQKRDLQKIINQVKKLESDKKLIQEKIKVIADLKKKSALTVHILDEVANLTPTKRVWLKNLNQAGLRLSISGMALDNQTIANYMDELKKSPYISNVNLLSTSMAKYAGRNLKSFSMACSLKLPTPKKSKPAAKAIKQRR